MFALDESLGYWVNRVAARMALLLGEALKPFDVTPVQFGTLVTLFGNEGISQKNLAERTYKDPPATARILDRLQEKGLVRREPDPRDKRAFRVYLTQSGRELVPRLIPYAEAVNQKAYGEADGGEVLAAIRAIDGNLA